MDKFAGEKKMSVPERYASTMHLNSPSCSKSYEKLVTKNRRCSQSDLRTNLLNQAFLEDQLPNYSRRLKRRNLSLPNNAITELKQDIVKDAEYEYNLLEKAIGLLDYALLEIRETQRDLQEMHEVVKNLINVRNKN